MVKNETERPLSFAEWVEEKVNNLLGNDPIDWRYRHFQNQLVKDNPEISKIPDGDLWLTYRGKQLYEDIKAGARLQPEDYAGLMAEPLNLAKALAVVDTNRGLAYQEHLQAIMHNQLGLKEGVPDISKASQRQLKSNIPTLSELLIKYQVQDQNATSYHPGQCITTSQTKGLSV